MEDAVYQYLKRFVDITPGEFEQIMKFVEVRHFNKRVKLADIGEKERYLNFIMRGLVRKYFYRNNDEEVITQIAKEGDLICSSVSFLTGEESEYVVETIEPTTVFSISRENMEIIYSMSNKMERLGRLVMIDWLLQKEYWESNRIRHGPKENFLKFIGSNPDLLIRVPQKYLASYLNIKPETFSRYKHLLKKRPKNGLQKEFTR
jgi:CRP-like cAMP-binding protein